MLLLWDLSIVSVLVFSEFAFLKEIFCIKHILKCAQSLFYIQIANINLNATAIECAFPLGF